MMTPPTTEHFEIALNTAAGQITTAVEVPTGFVPVTAIVPLIRRLGEEAHALEVARSVDAGKPPSCHKGCAACCRMLVPLSAPEAFALREWVRARPTDHQERIGARFSEVKSRLLSQSLWQRLSELCNAPGQPSDDALEMVNREYYALRLPCPFLEEEVCTIYEVRPAACRELLVSSPPERCDDIINNPVEPIGAPVSVSTVLGLLWQELGKSPTRLIPLPVALDWANGHEHENQQAWKGVELLDGALDKTWRFLSQSIHETPETLPDKGQDQR
ncbi:MAG: YkgJ family cysteine cluster protein [Nitrospira sp.]|nr:YkgJ family cysteine cluster protein [Nitrospira sp.]